MIEVSNDGTLCVLTINRPDKANSLTAEMLEQLCVGVEEARSARAIILTGIGKVFSAGADLEAAKAGLALSPLWERLSGALSRHPGLTIAALNGTVAGGAMGMVLACDLRIAVPGTKVFYPVMKLGFLPQPSDPARLAQLVGPSRAKMILMAGQKIPTEDALTWGLIDRIVEPADLLDHAKSLAEDVCSATPDHARSIKGLIAQSLP
ncbi:enoyl-CoA hydratase/isomerase family protein [Marivita sp. S6314]|uniref:enoyl-CoA hydratase/isomerase family protein n=1 Tax=Marivita sp. S6314 TaxID=2926406 RepID=UPI001FF386F4|nr:enoyl-CoA hydratase/isomerase family protein [Marivita sp. S6314]MCK0149943.1 enoyl-CoA hydratase/isomerase family protein [Marivita sp. S6314]